MFQLGRIERGVFEMMHVEGNNTSRSLVGSSRRGLRGYSIVELLIVVLVGGVLTAIAVPKVQSSLNQYHLDGAVASTTWAIQSTRYQALVQGVQYQVVFNTTTNTYQIQSSADGGVTFTNAGSNGAVPISGSAVVMNQNTTLRFKPNGYVSAPVGALNYTITYQGLSEQVCVSNYANIKVIATSQTCPS
jgi:prepilin-type N-terminal cleavage/methylation domain-containing protein